MNRLPFIAMNAFAEPVPHNFTPIHLKIQVFHVVFQGWEWITEPSISLLLVLVETNDVYLCHDTGEGESCLYLSLCAMVPGDIC